MIEIKSTTGKLLLTIDAANLEGANLEGAYLRNADLEGASIDGEKVTHQPVLIVSLHWFVLITDGYMRIGCQRHTHAEWRAFTDKQIHKMDIHALAFWTQYKTMLLGICDSMKGGAK